MELAAIIELINKKRFNYDTLIRRDLITIHLYCTEIRADSFSLSLSFLPGSFADGSFIYFNDASSKIRN